LGKSAMTAATGTLLRLQTVSKSFGGVRALSDVSLSVSRDQIAGIIGPNGAGKTTLFNVITGALQVDSGDIAFDGRSLVGWPPYRIVRAGLARTFQNIRLFSSMTVWEHLIVAQRRSGIARQLLPLGCSGSAVLRRAEEVLQLFGLEKYRGALARTLPYGIQRKVEMARAVTAEPKLLLLDEPVAGMNGDESEEVRTLLLRLNERGISLLLIEHDMVFMMKLCHHLYVLDFGTLIASGNPPEIRDNPRVLEAYLGEEAGC
jgi:branched-chain amino acid transport system ATP-binding protein